MNLDPDELQSLGHLQEVNRLYFHPRGLALAVDVPGEWVKAGVFVRDASKPSTLSVIDWREDLEGGFFEWPSEEEATEAKRKAQQVEDDALMRRVPREAALGYWIQPIPE